MEALNIVRVQSKVMEEKEKEALYVLKKDVSKWLSCVLKESITPENFMSQLDTGVTLCRLAKKIQRLASEKKKKEEEKTLSDQKENPQAIKSGVRPSSSLPQVPMGEIYCNHLARKESFQARDNTANFITWVRRLGLDEAILFESEGLVLHRDEKRVILTLLGVARIGGELGMVTPTLVEMEKEIDSMEHGKEVVKISRGDEQILSILHDCACTEKPLQAVSHGRGKFYITTSTGRHMMIFIRILHEQVMVRVGGGWDTLDHFLLKHDPCRVGGASVAAGLAKDIKKKSTKLEMPLTRSQPLRVRQGSPSPFFGKIGERPTGMRKCTSTPSLSTRKRKGETK